CIFFIRAPIHHGDAPGDLKFYSVSVSDFLTYLDNIGKLPHPGRFDHDPVRLILPDDFPDPIPEIYGQAAADASCIKLFHWNIGLDQISIQPDFPIFVFNDHCLPGKQRQILLQKGCLSGSEKTGYDLNVHAVSFVCIKKGPKRHNVTAVLPPPKKIILIYSRSPDSISSSASAFPFSRVAYPEGCPSHSRAGCSGFSPDSLFNALASLYTLH